MITWIGYLQKKRTNEKIFFTRINFFAEQYDSQSALITYFVNVNAHHQMFFVIWQFEVKNMWNWKWWFVIWFCRSWVATIISRWSSTSTRRTFKVRSSRESQSRCRRVQRLSLTSTATCKTYFLKKTFFFFLLKDGVSKCKMCSYVIKRTVMKR